MNENNMTKQLVIIGIIVIVAASALSGCFQDPKETKTIDAPLNTLALTLDGLVKDYQIIEEDYITEPYIAEEDLLFGGWKILEKYKITFLENETSFIQHLLAKLESKEKAMEFVNNIRTNVDELGYNFTELSMDPIGNESYLGVNTTTISEKEVTIYFLCFGIEDVAVVLQGSGLSTDAIVEYAKIVENNINAVLISQ